MTQRVELATVRDRLAVDELVTDYAVAVDDGDWETYRRLFTADGRADHRAAGGIEGDARAVAGWLAERFAEFPVRQHLFVNRRVRLGTWERDTGDTAEVRADYVLPAGRAGEAGAAAGLDMLSGGRCDFSMLRTDDGWRLTRVVVREKWRRLPGSGRMM
ncbi:nuclear transport factor 2 family protein [Streptomyces sp. Vc74B-19]|uniref:nuclear transport factor 2 family protein n=1 Tax=unclassified Streptomyces TaxID=2593676 RepID=UPI001BFCC01F|nr:MULTISPECIES: nuclear transport factor 2 family protein [unclassified Streptomyces]MBT3164794.1 nuclear transport factor 2 family protein [Streptomyces sp. Vc74B-19]MCO4697236.1 nuclear transport factor 2 family protein [Streptomyces sp. RO-S4]